MSEEYDYQLLADEVKSYIKRFCYMDSESKYDIATLWVFHTHVRNSEDKLAFAETPRLAILSDGPASGKSRLLELVNSLSFNGQVVLSPSPAGLLSALTEDNATVALDEIDLYFGRSNRADSKAILNGGYRAGSFVRHGNAKKDTFGPIVMCGMGANFLNNQTLSATRSRSIILRMLPRPDDAKLESYRAVLQRPYAEKLKSVITYWGSKNANDLAFSMPDLPPGISDRDADIWAPLLACGEFLGKRWSDMAKNACKTSVLSTSSEDARPLTPQEQLMRDLHKVLDMNAEKMSTAIILEGLMDANPTWKRHINARSAAMELSATLRPLGIEPMKVWIDDKAVQGYRTAEFKDHLPTFGPSDSSDVYEEDDADLLPI